MSVGLLTAIYDHYDRLDPLVPQDIEVDAVCVTDDPDLEAEGWRIVVDPKPHEHPNRAAKVPKFCPWRYTTAHASVWIDGSFRVRSSAFVREVLEYADPIAQFAHWERDCVYSEAQVSAFMAKYQGQPMEDQARDYLERCHPPSWGLWASGMIARRHTSEVMLFGQAWLCEVERWTFQDQVSEPVVLREVGLRPTSVPGTYFENPWLSYEASGRH